MRQKMEEGNAAFNSGKFSEAYDLYTQALTIDPKTKSTNAKLYFNRATVAARVSLPLNFIHGILLAKLLF